MIIFLKYYTLIVLNTLLFIAYIVLSYLIKHFINDYYKLYYKIIKFIIIYVNRLIQNIYFINKKNIIYV